MTDRAPPAGVDLATAEAISAALLDIARPLSPGVIKPTVEQQVAGGLLEVRHAGDSMVCRYDPAVGTPTVWDMALRRELGDRMADLVRYVPARTAPAELVDLLNEVVARDWHPRASSTDVGAHLDWERELLVIHLGAEATDEVATTLKALAGDRAVIEYGQPFRRR